MTLHKVVETSKKVGIGAGIGVGVLLVLFFIIKIGGIVISLMTPPKILPPNQAYDILPAIQFPQSDINNDLTYVLNTISGTLPSDFPDRVHVYPITIPNPSLLNLEKAKEKARTLEFMDREGNTLPETSLGNGKYQWAERQGINRRIIFDILTFNFSMSSNYLSSLTVLGAENLSDEKEAIKTAKDFLGNIELYPEDIDIDKIQTPQKNTNYNTFPKLFAIRNGTLVSTTSLSNAKVIRVNFYQKDIEYDMDTGQEGAQKLKMKLPIYYPDPPHSTMSFWIASGQSVPEVTASEFIHHVIATGQDNPATYLIKTAEEAFDELKNGNAYIASYFGLDKEILISDIYLAYYLGEEIQEYLMPIIVFEGKDGFFAYVSAVKTDWVK